jgi:hypothetical protein
VRFEGAFAQRVDDVAAEHFLATGLSEEVEDGRLRIAKAFA